jgi:hypothetical protein
LTTPWDRVADRVAESAETTSPASTPSPFPSPFQDSGASVPRPTPSPVPRPTPRPAPAPAPTIAPQRDAAPSAGFFRRFLQDYVPSPGEIGSDLVEAFDFSPSGLADRFKGLGQRFTPDTMWEDTKQLIEEGFRGFDAFQRAGSTLINKPLEAFGVPPEILAEIWVRAADEALTSPFVTGTAGPLMKRLGVGDLGDPFDERIARRLAADEASKSILQKLRSGGLSVRDAEKALQEALESEPLSTQILGSFIDPFAAGSVVKTGARGVRAGIRGAQAGFQPGRAQAAGLLPEDEMARWLSSPAGGEAEQTIRRTVSQMTEEELRRGIRNAESSILATQEAGGSTTLLERQLELMRNRLADIEAGPGMAPGTTAQGTLGGEMAPPAQQGRFIDTGVSGEVAPLIDADVIRQQAAEAQRLVDEAAAGQQALMPEALTPPPAALPGPPPAAAPAPGAVPVSDELIAQITRNLQESYGEGVTEALVRSEIATIISGEGRPGVMGRMAQAMLKQAGIDLGAFSPSAAPPPAAAPSPAGQMPIPLGREGQALFVREIEDGLQGYLGEGADAARSDYVINNNREAMDTYARAASENDLHVEALQDNLVRMGVPETVTVYKGHTRGTPVFESGKEFENASFSRRYAEAFRKAFKAPPDPEDWVVSSIDIPRGRIVGIGSAEESEIIFRTTDISAPAVVPPPAAAPPPAVVPPPAAVPGVGPRIGDKQAVGRRGSMTTVRAIETVDPNVRYELYIADEGQPDHMIRVVDGDSGEVVGSRTYAADQWSAERLSGEFNGQIAAARGIEAVPTPVLAADEVVPPRSVQTSKPRYRDATPQFDSPLDKALYIVANPARKSAKDAEIMQYAMAATGLSADEVRAAGREIRAAVKGLYEPGADTFRVPRQYDAPSVAREVAPAPVPTPPPGAVPEPPGTVVDELTPEDYDLLNRGAHPDEVFQARYDLDNARVELEVARAPGQGTRAPEFGTLERAEWEAARKQAAAEGLPPPPNKRQRVARARENVKAAEKQLKEAQGRVGKVETRNLAEGDSARVEGRDVVLAQRGESNNIVYELFTGIDADDVAGYVRVFDKASGDIRSSTQYPDQLDAFNAFDRLIFEAAGARPPEIALTAPIHGLDDIPAIAEGVAGGGAPPGGIPPVTFNGEPPHDPSDAIAWFRTFLNDPKRIAEWNLTKEWRRRAKAGRAVDWETRVDQLRAEGFGMKEAHDRAVYETLRGTLPSVPTGLHEVATPILTDALYQYVYAFFKAQPESQQWEAIGTIEALKNALAGRKAIPRDRGTAESSAYDRLVRVFGKDPAIIEALDKPRTLQENLALLDVSDPLSVARSTRPRGPRIEYPRTPMFGETIQPSLGMPPGEVVGLPKQPMRLEPPPEYVPLPPDYRTETEKALYRLAFKQLVEGRVADVSQDELRRIAGLEGNEFFRAVRAISPKNEWIEYPRLQFGETTQQALARESGMALDPPQRGIVLDQPSPIVRVPLPPDYRTETEKALYRLAFQQLVEGRVANVSQDELRRIMTLEGNEFFQAVKEISPKNEWIEYPRTGFGETTQQGLPGVVEVPLESRPQDLVLQQPAPPGAFSRRTPQQIEQDAKAFLNWRRKSERAIMTDQDKIVEAFKTLGVTGYDLGNLARSNISSFDVSWWRQNAGLILGNLPQFLRGNRAFAQAARSATMAKQLSRARQESQWWGLYQDLKLDFIRPLDSTEAAAWRQAEEFPGYYGQAEEFPGRGGTRPLQRLAEWLPWVRVSGRAHISALNEMNWAIWTDGLESIIKRNEAISRGDKTHVWEFVWRNQEHADSMILPRVRRVKAKQLPIQKEANALGRMLEDFTGRGRPGALKGITPALNAGFFSLRLQLGRMMSPTHLFRGTSRSRKEAWKNVLATIGTFTSVLFAGERAGAWELETDPRSPDFMKIRLGKVRIDPWGGYQQFVVFLARNLPEVGGIKSSETGQVREIDTIRSVGGLARSKLSPMASLLYDAKTGKTFTGETMSATEADQWLDRMLPFTLNDFREAVQDGGIRAAGKVVPGIFGAGVLQYDLPRWPELDEYYEIEGYEISPGRDVKTSALKLQYRRRNPLAEARLFVRGDITTLKTRAARGMVLEIMREHSVNPRDVPGYEKVFKRKDLPTATQAGQRTTTVKNGSQQAIAPENTWQGISAGLEQFVLVGLADLWFPEPGKESRPLNARERERLQRVYSLLHPEGTNFETWHKQDLRELFHQQSETRQ